MTERSREEISFGRVVQGMFRDKSVNPVLETYRFASLGLILGRMRKCASSRTAKGFGTCPGRDKKLQ